MESGVPGPGRKSSQKAKTLLQVPGGWEGKYYWITAAPRDATVFCNDTTQSVCFFLQRQLNKIMNKNVLSFDCHVLYCSLSMGPCDHAHPPTLIGVTKLTFSFVFKVPLVYLAVSHFLFKSTQKSVFLAFPPTEAGG